MIDPHRNPGGTTVLITGERGAGKTSLVNAAIFHASMVSRFGTGWLISSPPVNEENATASTSDGSGPGIARKLILDEEAWKDWEKIETEATTPVARRKPYLLRGFRGGGADAEIPEADQRVREARNKARETRAKNILQNHAIVLLDVHVPLPESDINEHQVLSRTLRRLYFRLVTAGIADANPEFVRNARLAYIRSVARDIEYSKASKYTQSFSAGMEKGEVGIAAKQEMELSWELTITLEKSTSQEMGDDLQLLLEDLARLRLGGEGILKRSIRSLKGMFEDIVDFFAGTERLRIHPVIIFDEIDKAISLPSKEGMPGQPSSDDRLQQLSRIVGALKTVLTAHGASFIFISGPEHARLWSSAGRNEAKRSGNLRSVFSDRFHARRLGYEDVLKMIEKCLADPTSDLEQKVGVETLTAAAHYVSGGLMRSLVRMLREAQLKNRTPARDRGVTTLDLCEVLAATTRKQEQKLIDTIESLAASDRVVVGAQERLITYVQEMEAPSAATRVAGKFYALRDAMWPVAQSAYEALRGVAKTPQWKANPENHDAFPIQHVVLQLIASEGVADALLWIPRATLGSSQIFGGELELVVIRKVLESMDEQEGEKEEWLKAARASHDKEWKRMMAGGSLRREEELVDGEDIPEKLGDEAVDG